jgi:hypothetical protein
MVERVPGPFQPRLWESPGDGGGSRVRQNVAGKVEREPKGIRPTVWRRRLQTCFAFFLPRVLDQSIHEYYMGMRHAAALVFLPEQIAQIFQIREWERFVGMPFFVRFQGVLERPSARMKTNPDVASFAIVSPFVPFVFLHGNW